MDLLNTNIKSHKRSEDKVRGKHIIIAGGGTGGHIFPAIAIANALKQKNSALEILFIGAEGKMEMEKVPQAGYTIKGLSMTGLNRQSILKNIFLPYKIAKSFLQVRNIFKVFKPDAVIGVGGYSSYPVLRFAQIKGVYSFIHESNSFAGKSNILLGKKATKVFVASDGMEIFFPKSKLMITGNPIRKTIADSIVSRTEGLNFFGLNESKVTILVVGGSLGAGSINDAIGRSLDRFQKNDLQLIWQTGKTKATEYKALAFGNNHIWTNEFIKEIEMGYAAADIVVSRSGAMAVSELSATGKATIFVPYPLAAEDHQTSNAMRLVNKQAALIVKDNEANEKLVNTIIALSKNIELQMSLKKNIKTLSIVDADEVIANEILNTLND